jgi:hypothetical protein
MRTAYERRGGAEVLVHYLNEPPDPKPRPLNGYYFRAAGYEVKGSTYTRDGVVVKYDGVYWTFGEQRIETIEELEKLIG